MKNDTAPKTKEQKLQAKKLVEGGQHTQEQIAQKIGTSDRTIRTWTRKYGWLPDEEKELYHRKPPDSLIEFIVHLSNEYPDQHTALLPIYKTYINQPSK